MSCLIDAGGDNRILKSARTTMLSGIRRNLLSVSSMLSSRQGTAQTMPGFARHIGAGKTGGSTIQSIPKINRKVLGSLGYFMPGSDLAHGKVTGKHVWAAQNLMNSENQNAKVAYRPSMLGQTVPQNKTILTALIPRLTGLFKEPHDSNFYHIITSLMGSDFVPKIKVSFNFREARKNFYYHCRRVNQKVCRERFKERKRLFPEIVVEAEVKGRDGLYLSV